MIFFPARFPTATSLARDWNASLTYRYLHRTATTGGTLLDPVTGLPTSVHGSCELEQHHGGGVEDKPRSSRWND